MEALFTPVRKEATREKVCEAIRSAIITGKLPVGERLPELRLTREFEVSRAVIREALQQLAYEGFVQLNINRGAQVIDLTPQQVDEILSLRVVLESEAVEQARRRMSNDQRRMLRKMAAQVDASRSDMESFIPADVAFHRAIWKCSGNETLQRHLILLTAPMFSMGSIMRHSAMSAAAKPVRGASHVRLAEAILDGTVEEARHAVRHHIAENWDRTRTAVETFHQGKQRKRPRSQSA
ncbi:MAG: GntR family transcriptional regulator [Bryobacterales bacterium]|nr:GntR family transcriptional regulator [Bryobacterales bacterium]